MNSMLNAQSVLAASAAPQPLLASTNGGVTLTLVMGLAVAPPFSAVICNALEVESTSTSPKLNVPGVRLRTGAAVPVPSSATVICPPAALAPMVSCPGRSPVAVGVKLTCIVQLAFMFTGAFTQLSVSLKSPLGCMPVIASAIPPVLVIVTVCAALVVPCGWLANVNEPGEIVAVVICVPEVNMGICHTPRPYVAAASTLGAAVVAAALSCTTGACGNPAPYADQQFDAALPQVATWRVAKTPTSVAM